jgi:alanyl-tRNA synthetase
MKTTQIRQKFLDFFESKGHTIEPSSSLIPANDKTLLFVNAGMVPFKDVFSGVEKRPYTRATSSQRCVRAGGKHNDLENVGYTARHHTFFEMLGNFSFGDYFKEEAIAYAWEFLTKELKLPADKLWVSVYEDDDEAENIWVEKIGFPKNRISRCGAKDNFWQMGDTGPCGPCSEIFYDHGEEIAGGPPGTAEEDGDRFIEIWNLVFTQFDKQADGHLKPLDAPCVDTGMGLERLAAVMQHQNNNYDTDGFTEITKEITKFASSDVKQTNPSVRVIADHIRSVSFLIADGVNPSNEGRGYVLRRIIRRALRHGHKIGIDNHFFYLLAAKLAYINKGVYPILTDNLAHIEKTIQNEEQKFSQTLSSGMAILEDEISKLKGKQISGEVAFKLYDTYGFPLDLTADIARERDLSIDNKGFDKAMAKQQEMARKSGNFKATNTLLIDKTSDFKGYEDLTTTSEVVAIIQDNKEVNNIKDNAGIIILDNTPFYAESGGQTGDIGELKMGDNIFNVSDTQKQKTGAFEHYGTINGELKVGDKVVATVDTKNRENIAKNHSATHLLHAALKEILGENVNQKGSLVDSEKLRFDFSYNEAIDKNTLNKIEALVNEKILTNTKVHTEIMNIEAAKKRGAMALFGEKYEEEVRVLSMGLDDFSVELCGGTHAKNLGDIGGFRIVSESGVASGVRRIEAVSGFKAYEFDKNNQQIIENIAKVVKSVDVENKVISLASQNKELEKQLSDLQKKLGGNIAGDLAEGANQKDGFKVVATKVEGVQNKDLADLMDKVRAKIGSGIVVLAIVEADKISVIAGVSKDLTAKFNAGNIIKDLCGKLGGKGGGRPDMARGGISGTDGESGNIQNLDNELQNIYNSF